MRTSLCSSDTQGLYTCFLLTSMHHFCPDSLLKTCQISGVLPHCYLAELLQPSVFQVPRMPVSFPMTLYLPLAPNLACTYVLDGKREG